MMRVGTGTCGPWIVSLKRLAYSVRGAAGQMRKKEKNLPPAMPRAEYARLLKATNDACKPLLERVIRESTPRYQIIPQRWVQSAGSCEV
jgi:hypothetical protein